MIVPLYIASEGQLFIDAFIMDTDEDWTG
jgi:hypothetical protein